jgi:hypothetical protein
VGLELNEQAISLVSDIDRLRKLNGLEPCDVPSLGFTVKRNDIVIAAGFLRLMEGDIGMIDGYVTDPTALSKDRHSALNELTDKIIIVAKELKLKGLLVFTSDESIKIRAEAAGFIDGHQSVFVLPLR